MQLAFSVDEYLHRVDAVRSFMSQCEADALLVDEAEDLCYLTGFAPSATMYQVCVIFEDRSPLMVFRRLDEPTFLEQSWLTDYVVFGDAENPVEVLARTLAAKGFAGKRIAVGTQSHFMPAAVYEQIKGNLPDATFVGYGAALRELRLRKSPAEIAYLRKAAHIADQAMRVAISALRVGESERVAAAAASRAFITLGADHGRTGPIVSGKRSHSMHGNLRDVRLALGDVVHIELSPQVNGYTSRVMRPTVIGKPTGNQCEVANRLIEIQNHQLDAMKPGKVANEIDRYCRARVLEAGLRDNYDNVTGYTLGYYGVWVPRASDFTRVFLPTSDWVLEAGMVFHMYALARGMAFSETVLVTENGHERLTQLERRLFAVEA